MKTIIRSCCCLFVVLAFMSIICGCTSCPKKKQIKEEYKTVGDTIEQWTRSSKLYRDFETIVLVDATYKNLDLRRAFVNKYALDHAISETEKNELLKEAEADYRKHIEFLINVYVGEDEWDDFNELSSTWSIYLIDDKGNRLKPTKVDKCNKLSTDELDFYPEVTPWKTTYLISFPIKIPGSETYFIKANTEAITLELTGSPGKVILTWTL